MPQVMEQKNLSFSFVKGRAYRMCQSVIKYDFNLLYFLLVEETVFNESHWKQRIKNSTLFSQTITAAQLMIRSLNTDILFYWFWFICILLEDVRVSFDSISFPSTIICGVVGVGSSNTVFCCCASRCGSKSAAVELLIF